MITELNRTNCKGVLTSEELAVRIQKTEQNRKVRRGTVLFTLGWGRRAAFSHVYQLYKDHHLLQTLVSPKPRATFSLGTWPELY